MLAIILPTRGLIHSRTVESLLQELDSHMSFYMTHDLPMPDCFNNPITQALEDGADPIMILEEDVVLPPNGITDLQLAIERGADISYFYAPISSVDKTPKKAGPYIIGGTCAIMFKSKVLESLMPFTMKRDYHAKTGELLGETALAYGGQDIDMFIRAQQAGYEIECVGEADHLHVRKLGTPGQNNSYHDIVSVREYNTPRQDYII